MKRIKREVLTLTMVVCVTSLSFSQENDAVLNKEKKHAIGISYNFSTYFESFDFNYIYYLDKFNLKGGIEVLNPDNRDFGHEKFDSYTSKYSLPQPLMLSDVDSMGRFYGIDENYYQKQRYVKLNLGAEKVFFKEDRINLLLGADLYLGIYKRINKSNVNHYLLDSVENRSLSNEGWEPQHYKYGKFLSEENVRTTEFKNIILGVQLNAGILFNLSERIFAVVDVNLDFSKSISEKNN